VAAAAAKMSPKPLLRWRPFATFGVINMIFVGERLTRGVWTGILLESTDTLSIRQIPARAVFQPGKILRSFQPFIRRFASNAAGGTGHKNLYMRRFPAMTL
jgi:hypothetical protein